MGKIPLDFYLMQMRLTGDTHSVGRGQSQRYRLLPGTKLTIFGGFSDKNSS
jgi:hypothetical protein